MRKLTVILFALLGLVFFNSCKDETTDEKPQPVDTKILTELKGYTGKTFDEVSLAMNSKGFAITDEESGEGYAFYTFSNSNSTISYDFLEYQDFIGMAGYSLHSDNRNFLISNFEQYSLSAVTFIGNTANVYNGVIETLNSLEGNLEFENRTNLLSFYNQNKNNIVYCYENWIAENYVIGCEFDYADDDEYQNNCSLLYVDKSLSPPIFDKSNKSIFKLLQKNRR